MDQCCIRKSDLILNIGNAPLSILSQNQGDLRSLCSEAPVFSVFSQTLGILSSKYGEATPLILTVPNNLKTKNWREPEK